MDFDNAKKQGLNLVISLFLIIAVITFLQWYRVVSVNNTDETVLPGDTKSKITLEMSNTTNASDKWTREFPDMNDPNKVSEYTGTTFGCNMINGLNYEVKNWTLKITVHDECYFNGFWGGTMEIHQFRDGMELVDSIDTNSPDLAALKVEYNQYSEPLLIHMVPGDYIRFIPNENVEKDFNRNEKRVTLIMNWYYQDELSLDDYELDYRNNMKIGDGHFNVIFMSLLVIWVIITNVYFVMIIIYKQTKKGMERHYSGISIMAGIYDFVCCINIDNDSYHVIKNKKSDSDKETNGKDIQAYLDKCVSLFCAEPFQKEVKDFLDISTIKERIENKPNLVYEFKNADGGWGVFRIINGENIGKSILVVEEDITEEKENVKQVSEYREQFETDKKLRGDFFNNISYSLEQLIGEIISSNEELKNISTDRNVLDCAEKINISTEHLHVLQNSILDMIAIENDKFELRESQFSIKAVTDEVSRILSPFYKDAPYEYGVSIDSAVFDNVCADKNRLKQVLVLLLFSPLVATRQGTVKLIIYGKKIENEEEIIFSVRDTGDGIPPEFLALMRKSLEQPNIAVAENAGSAFIKLIDNILREMNSKLNIVNVVGDGTEMYFSLRLKIANEIEND